MREKKPTRRARTPSPEKPRAIATVSRVDDPARLDALLSIMRHALDERRARTTVVPRAKKRR